MLSLIVDVKLEILGEKASRQEVGRLSRFVAPMAWVWLWEDRVFMTMLSQQILKTKYLGLFEVKTESTAEKIRSHELNISQIG